MPPETDFPCCETKPEWYSDRFQQAVNRCLTNKARADLYARESNVHQGTELGRLLARKSDDYLRQAHDAVLEAAEAVRQERAS